MPSEEDLKDIIFLDIETVPAFQTIAEVPEDLREIWIDSHGTKKSKKSKTKSSSKTDDTSDDDAPPTSDFNYGLAGLYPEFGRIICISCCFLVSGSRSLSSSMVSRMVCSS